MSENVPPSDELLGRLRLGDTDALAEIFSQYRERLRRIVRFRLDYRLAGRLSESDVLQETFIAAAKRLPRYAEQDDMPAFLWLRLIAAQELVDLQRKHIVAEKRDVRREISLVHQSTFSGNTSVAIAAQLIGQNTGASQLLEQAERIERLETTLNAMDATDREVIAMRHFEELSNVETANVLAIDPSAASKRYLRAMKRLAELMADFVASESA